MWSLTLQWFPLNQTLDQKSLKTYFSMDQFLRKIHPRVLINQDPTTFSANPNKTITKIHIQTKRDQTSSNSNQAKTVVILNQGSFHMILILNQRIHFNKTTIILQSINSNRRHEKGCTNIHKFHQTTQDFLKMSRHLSLV